MTKLKDKLSANMRMVKANQQPAPTAAKPAAHKPATKPVEKPAAPRRAPTAGKTVAGDVPDSGSELFPTRVWPD